MNVLSLFDGISCGRVALERAGIPVEKYYAFEIDPNAIKISQKNYPDIIQCGDVFNSDFKEFTDIDLIIGGSPCTLWSKSKNHTAKQNKEVKPEGIGWELFKRFALTLKAVKHKYFLYENNYGIADEIIEAISEELGVQPIMINSNKVSAQNRKRLYWTNIPNIQQPEDKGILLKDIFVYDKSLVKTDPRILKTAVKTKNYIKYDLLGKGHFSQA
jgi:DNA (cytosine-5)-methyltransferase 3A